MKSLISLLSILLVPLISSGLGQQFGVVHRFESGPSAPSLGAFKTTKGTVLVVCGGGQGEAGCIAEYSATGQNLVKVADFASIGATVKVPYEQQISPKGVALDSADNLYGWAVGGPGGVLWRWSATSGLEIIHHFEVGTLWNPINNVVSDGSAIYGSCSSGGANGYGGLWKWTASSGLELVRSHEGTFTFQPLGLAFADGVIYGLSGEYFGGLYSAHLWKLTPSGTYARIKVQTLGATRPNGMVIPYDGGVVWGTQSNSSDSQGLYTCDLYQTTAGGVVTLLHTLSGCTSLSGQGGTLNGGGFLAGGFFAGSYFILESEDYIWKLSSESGFQIQRVDYPQSIFSTSETAPSGKLIIDGDAVIGMGPAGLSEVSFDGTYDHLAFYEGDPLGSWLTGIAVDSTGSVMTSVFHGGRTLRWNRSQPNKPEVLAGDFTGGIQAGNAMMDAAGNFLLLALEPSAIGKVSPNGVSKVVASLDEVFESAPTGYSMVQDKLGNLFGTVKMTLPDSSSQTWIWRCTPAGKVSVMSKLKPEVHGTEFSHALTIAPDGTIFGASSSGGAHGQGALWKWSPSRGLGLVTAFETPEDMIDGGVALLPDGTLVGVNYFSERVFVMPPNSPISSISLASELHGQAKQHGMVVGTDGRLYVLSLNGGAQRLGALWRLNEVGGIYSVEVLHEMTRQEIPCYDYSCLTVAPDGSLYGTGVDGVWRYGAPQAPISDTFAEVLLPGELRPWMAKLTGMLKAPSGVTKVEFLLGTSAKSLNRVTPVMPVPDTTGGDAVEVSVRVAGLKAKTNHYCQLRFTATDGVVTISPIKTFFTPASDSFGTMQAITDQISNPASLGAVLTGSLAPSFYSVTEGFFVLGLSPSAMHEVHVTSPAIVAPSFGAPSTPVSASLSNLQPHTRYYYELMAAEGTSLSKGGVKSFVTPNAQPTAASDSLKFVPGAKSLLTVLVNDTDADSDMLRIKSVGGWNTANGKLERQDHQIVITSAVGYAGGTFTYTVTDGHGGESTAIVTLVPSGVQLIPTFGNVDPAGGLLSFSVTTLSSWFVEEKTSWISTSPSAGQGNGTVQVMVSANPGVATRTAQVKIGDQTFGVAQSGQLPPSFGPLGAVPVATAGTWYHLPIPIVNPPVSYSVTGLPPGLKVNTVTNTIEGFPTTPVVVPHQVKVIASNKAGTTKLAPLVFAIQVSEPEPVLQGGYHALIGPGSLNTEIGGQLAVAITHKGGMTGSVANGGITYRLNGLVDSGDVASAENALGFYRSIIRQKGAPDLLLELRFHPDSQTDMISGRISRPDGSQPLLIEGGKLATSAAIGPFAENQFQVFFTAPSTVGNQSPEGPGTLRLKVGSSGALQWLGSLADGTAVVGTGSLRKSGLAPLHVTFAKGLGSIQGVVELTSDPGGNGDHSVGGTVRWIKKASASRAYQRGFLVAPMSVSGHRHRPPSLGALSLAADSSAAAPGSNATLSFSGAGLDLALQRGWETQSCLIKETGRPTTSPEPLTNPTAVKFTLYDTTNGLFAGTFTLTDGVGKRVVKFSGLLDEVGRIGKGWFLLPQLPVNAQQSLATSPILSGALTFVPSN